MDTQSNSNYGRYVPIRLLGEGAMGRVILAEDPVLQRKLAIKVIAIDEHLNSGTRDEYLTRFTLEARASAKLNHPSIVTVHDAGEENGDPWIAFEYVDGEQFDELLKRNRPMPIERTTAIIRDIASALAHAHAAGIVHRDIKPANILIDSRTHIAKLADFGIAKAPWTALTQEGKIVGSPGYMSPEQIDGGQIDARSDLFSLGVVFYEALTGKHPFLRDTVAATLFATVSQTYEPLRSVRPQVPPALEEAVRLCLTVNREQRIRSASHLMELLSGLAQDGKPAHGAIPVLTTALPRIDERITDFLRGSGRQVRAVCLSAADGLRKTGLTAATRKYLGRIGEKLARTIHSRKPGIGALVTSLRGRPGLVVLAGLLGALFLLLATPSVTAWSRHNRIVRELRAEGFSGSAQQAIDHCKRLVAGDSPEDAESLARILCNHRSTKAEGRILLGRIAARDREYEDAAAELDRARQAVDGSALVRKETGTILKDVERDLTKREASKSLIDLIVRSLSAGRHRTVKGWVQAEDYWLRWNAVRILGADGAKVDSVEVYILDLKHAGSMSTRYRAVRKLGEFGDRRAKPALEEAAAKGFRDPLVSSAAAEVLDRKFR